MKTLLTIEHCWMYNPITCKRDKKCPCINMPAIKGECIRESSTCYYYKDRVPLDTSKPYISGVTNEYNGKLFSAGFEMVFENGLTIVIRFGKEHYCTNYMKVEPYTCEDDKNSLISHTAEVFVYKTNTDGSCIWKYVNMKKEIIEDEGCEHSYLSPNEIAKLIGIVANWKEN